ncbi:hypothetical protein GCM10011608_48620 [Micromonospora sonchi]|uniref:DNA-binding domain-containing protein n=1 Tax=Micromonospora sonchi TaxID=1763543 RepID=A0A917X2N6_9ACTN|nr:leucine zipper domain-containing protein [Micromonospora sonchi]GGM57959.1 hypothetical protein GCM10011608_48620 [Micromonospora sonchi]
MTHANAPLSIEGRRRLVERCKDRPIAHVAAEMGISRACASKWVNRWRQHGELGLQDRSSTPYASPSSTPAEVIERIATWRREHKWSAQQITDELGDQVTVEGIDQPQRDQRSGPGCTDQSSRRQRGRAARSAPV